MAEEELPQKIRSLIKKGAFEELSKLLDSVSPVKIIISLEDIGDELIHEVFGKINYKNGVPEIGEKAFINKFNISKDSMLFGDVSDIPSNMLLFYEKIWERKLYMEFIRLLEDDTYSKILVPPAVESTLNAALMNFITDKSCSKLSIFAKEDFIKANGNYFFIEGTKIIIEQGGVNIFLDLFDMVSAPADMAFVLREDPTFWARIWCYISFNNDEGDTLLDKLFERKIIPHIDVHLKYHTTNIPEHLILKVKEAQNLLKS